MLRSASIFLAAILLPSLVLAWLAVRSARDQQVLLEHQQAVISQDVTDTLAKNVRGQLDTVRSEFVQITQDLLVKSRAPVSLAGNFDSSLREQWPLAEVGFSVDLHGAIYAPGRGMNSAGRTFRDENDRFLSNRENVEVYTSLNSQNLVAKQAPAESYRRDEQYDTGAATLADTPAGGAAQKSFATGGLSQTVANTNPVPAAAEATDLVSAAAAPAPVLRPPADMPAANAVPKSRSLDSLEKTDGAKDAQEKPAVSKVATKAASPADSSALNAMTTATGTAMSSPETESALPTVPAPAAATSPSYQFTVKLTQKANQIERQVSPQNNFNMAAATLSNTIPEESDFRRLIGDDTSGALARFLDNKLRLMVWFRASATDDLVFGAQLNQTRLLERLRAVVQAPELKERESSFISRTSSATYCLALLDDAGQPVALSLPGFQADWKHPFVATEIGETLPHWEAALYLTDPLQMSKSAHTLQFTLGLIVLLLVAAIAAGGSLIATDIRRQVRLARQKTDFVSNVSHELKTPLTSIRMFADLLSEGRVTEPERQATYLKIISAESARLTRLINNVLDFARLERGAPGGEQRPCDLVETTRDVVETCLPHLEAAGQALLCEIEAETLPVTGDRDALAQIILNLISNAEKYGGGEIVVRVRRQETAAGALGCVDVLDRGPGVPPKQVESIFLPFHRLHDSLSHGIPGSGLGLTLARRMARAHRGEITYSPRAGGGSRFTLAVPLTP